MTLCEHWFKNLGAFVEVSDIFRLKAPTSIIPEQQVTRIPPCTLTLISASFSSHDFCVREARLNFTGGVLQQFQSSFGRALLALLMNLDGSVRSFR